MRLQRGFSLVELVVVLLLTGIVAAVTFSRLGAPNSFNALATRDAIISTARAAQQLALGRTNVTFEIDPSGGDWLLTAKSGATVVRTATVPANSVILETGTTITAGDCASGFDDAVTSNFLVNYDGLGNATSFTNSVAAPVTIDNGVRICVNDDVSFSVCISPAGFASAGDCDD